MKVPRNPVEALLEETAQAHHEAFAATDGRDDEWPLWYATYLADRLPEVTGFSGTRSELVHWLVRLDEAYSSVDRTIPWTRFYAAKISAL